MRGLFGQGNKQHIVLTFGPDLDDAAFANLDRFNAVLAKHATQPGDRYLNLGKLVPPQEQISRCHDYFRAHPDFAARLREALGKDFNADAFGPFWEDWKGSGSPRTTTPPRRLRRRPGSSPGCATCCRCRCKTCGTRNSTARRGWGRQVSDGLYNRLPAGGARRAEHADRPGQNDQRGAAALPHRGLGTRGRSDWRSSWWRCWRSTAGGTAGSCW